MNTALTRILRVAAGFAATAISAVAVTISQSPASTTVESGQTATLAVSAAGTGTVRYQWRRLGVPINGAIQNRLTLSPARLSDAGFYDVIVSDDLDETVAAAAELTVLAPIVAPIYRMDPTFAPVLSRTGTAGVESVAVASDGSTVVGGNFAVFCGQVREHLTRLTPTMELDQSFRPSIDGMVEAVAVQSDGRILIGGFFSKVNGVTRKGIARLNADGSLDASFDLGDFINLNDGHVSSILVQPNGMILVGCWVSSWSDGVTSGVHRFLETGVRDGGFSFSPYAASVSAMALTPEGELYVAGSGLGPVGPVRPRLVRLNDDGAIDPGFVPVVDSSLEVSALALQGDGCVVLGGRESSGNVLRLLPNGSADPSFTPSSDIEVYSVSLLLQADGRILVGRCFPDGPHGKASLVRLNRDGTADPTFAPEAPLNESIGVLHAHPQGGFLAGGRFTWAGTQTVAGLARLDGAGGLIGAPAGPCGGTGTVSRALRLPGNKVLIVGSFTHVGTVPRAGAAVLNGDGTVDPGFNPGVGFGLPTVEYFCEDLLRDGAGRFLVRGTISSYDGVACNDFLRILPDGKLDQAFVAGLSLSLRVTGMLHGPRGEIYVATRRGSPDICRLLDSGTIDPSFIRPNEIRMSGAGLYAAQSDGRLVAVVPDGGLQRLNPDGSRDLSFDGSPLSPQGIDWDRLRGLDALADGGFLVNDGWTVFGPRRSQFSIWYGAAAAGVIEACDFTFRDFLSRSILPLDDGRLLVAGVDGQRGGVRSIGLVLLKAEPNSPAPVILHQPASLVVREGQPAMLSITMGGEGPFSYVWRKEEGFADHYMDPALSFPTAQLSDSGIYTVTVESDFGTVTSDEVQLTVHNEAFVSFSAWAADGFTADELANPAISGPDADPEGCGMTNLLRYAFKCPARGPIPGSPIQATIATPYGTTEYLAVLFRRKTYAPGLSYVVEGTDNLEGPWYPVDVYTPGLPEMVVAPDNIGMEWSNFGRRFLRVRVEQGP